MLFPECSMTGLSSVCVQLLSPVRLFVTPWTVAHQAPLPWYFPHKNTGMSCHFIIQGIFLTQGLNLRLLNWQADSLPLQCLGDYPLSTRQCPRVNHLLFPVTTYKLLFRMLAVSLGFSYQSSRNRSIM